MQNFILFDKINSVINIIPTDLGTYTKYSKTLHKTILSRSSKVKTVNSLPSSRNLSPHNPNTNSLADSCQTYTTETVLVSTSTKPEKEAPTPETRRTDSRHHYYTNYERCVTILHYIPTAFKCQFLLILRP